MKRMTFVGLRRAALIQGLRLWVQGEPAGSWTGPAAETGCATFLRRLRLQPRQEWVLQLRLRVVLEDGRQATTRIGWSPVALPSVRHMLGQGFAVLTEALPPAASMEAHRVLELVEGVQLLDLRGSSTPLHLRTAIKNLDTERIFGAHVKPCSRCQHHVVHDYRGRVANRHFLPDGNLCLPPTPLNSSSAPGVPLSPSRPSRDSRLVQTNRRTHPILTAPPMVL